MMKLKKHLGVNTVLLVILSILLSCSVKGGYAKEANYPEIIKADYVLIINSYTESSDWSNIFIRSITESVFKEKSQLTVYVEHMNMLMINTEEQLEEFKHKITSSYEGKMPKMIILLGNTPWGLLGDVLEKKWPKVPVMLCAEKDFTGPAESFLYKTPIEESQRIPLKEYKGGLDLTVLYIPSYIHETVGLMQTLMPNMNKVLFLCDNRYISKENRLELEAVIKTEYTNLDVEVLISDEIGLNSLSEKLRNLDSKTGILYYSWFKKNTLLGNIVLTTNDYKMFSRYTTSPVFTLTDTEITNVGMIGGYYLSSRQVAERTTDIFEKILKKGAGKGVVIADSGKPSPVLNYPVLLSKGISEELCPEDSIYYFKTLSVWKLYYKSILLVVFLILVLFSFMVLKMTMLRKIKLEQDTQIKLMNNYSSLFDNMPIAYSKQELIYDKEGEIIDYAVEEVNPYYEKYFMTKTTVLHKLGSVLNDSSFKDYINLYKLAIVDKKEITVQYFHQSSGKYFSMIIVPSKVDGFIDVFYVDNTELSTTQQLLRTLNYKLSMALDVANITPWKWNLKEGTILCDVKRISDLESMSLTDEQLEVPSSEYFSKIYKQDVERVRSAYSDLIEGRAEKVKEEYRVFSHHDNKSTYEWVEAQAVVDKRDENGEPLSLIGSSQVISDRKKMETDLIDAKEKAEESNRLKSAFLANMSHEIRTPLNAIVGFSEVLASAEGEQEKQEYVSIIENNNTLLLQLISDILDLSKIEAGTLEFAYSDIDLTHLFAELETSFRMRMTGDSVKIINENKLENCYINIDKNRLSQVIINLMNNAMKFTENGSIHFGFSLKDSKTLYFHVTDTGCGIPADKVESVFGRFVKLNNFVQGTGLGLSICQTIINCMNGEIGVTSKEGEGTTFWFTLPYNPQQKRVESTVVEKKEVLGRDKLTVLIAEDNASNFKLFETILKSEYVILHAWDGQEAVSMFEQHKPHIVLMDINMPKMNGYDATKKIREISHRVPIIAVTAYAYASDEQRIIDSGFDGYTAKPINSQMLKSQMMNLLKRQLIFM